MFSRDIIHACFTQLLAFPSNIQAGQACFELSMVFNKGKHTLNSQQYSTMASIFQTLYSIKKGQACFKQLVPSLRLGRALFNTRRRLWGKLNMVQGTFNMV
jgi:hypothetical protein